MTENTRQLVRSLLTEADLPGAPAEPVTQIEESSLTDMMTPARERFLRTLAATVMQTITPMRGTKMKVHVPSSVGSVSWTWEWGMARCTITVMFGHTRNGKLTADLSVSGVTGGTSKVQFDVDSDTRTVAKDIVREMKLLGKNKRQRPTSDMHPVRR